MLQYLLKNFKKSKGVTKAFWFVVLVVLGPSLGYHQFGDLLGKGRKERPAETRTEPERVGIGAKLTSLVRENKQNAPTVSPQKGPVRVYFTRPGHPADEPDNIARALVSYIDRARRTLDVCAFELDNRIITDALVNAVRRGVRVRLVTETNYIAESGVKALRTVGVPVIDDHRDGALMHNKFMVFDDEAVWTGSMNFTENCAYKNDNHGLFLVSNEIAANYATKFSWMFEQHKFGGLPSRTAKIPHPVVTFGDGTVIENYFSTHDHVAERVIGRIEQTRTTLHFLAFSYTHDGIAKAMLSRAQAGVQVQGVFEKTQTAGGHSQYDRLRAAAPRVQVYLDANSRNMHHKVVVIDSLTTIAGSFNFSESADKSNDENVVIIHNRDVAQQFEGEFQRVFGAAQHAAAGTTLIGQR